MRILFAEDDDLLAHAVGRSLEPTYSITRCSTCAATKQALLSDKYELLLLDLGLADGDAIELLKQIRSQGETIPVLIVTARDTLDDRVLGLTTGADDYLIKPFDLRELEARVQALLRRRYMALRGEFSVGNLRFDLLGKRMFVDERPVDLSAREMSVLELLVLNLGRVVSKDRILEKICDEGEVLGANAIEVYVHRLRKKIPATHLRFKTIRGLGYLLEKSA